MITFPAAVGAAIRSVQCALLNDNEYVVGSVGRFAGPVRQRALDGINATRDLLGCPTSPPIEPPAPDFEGGQCNDTYLVNTTTGSDLSNIETFTMLARGPIGGIRARPIGNDNFAIELLCTNLNAAQTICVELADAGIAWRFFRSVTSFTGNTTQQINFVTPCGSDNCGSLPPIYPPPISKTYNTNVTYNIDDGTEVNVSIPFVYAPVTVDFNGNFRIPVTFDFGGNEFSASFPLDVSIPVTINFPGLNPGDGDPTDTLPPGDPTDDVEPAPVGEKIIGVVVNSAVNSNAPITSISNADMPDTFAPRAGTVKFAYSLGAATFWSNDIDIKGTRVFIPCPFSQGADFVSASAAPGVTLDWVPIKGAPLATTADLGRTA